MKSSMEKYPDRLIPKVHYRLNMVREELRTYDPYLQRKCPCPHEECCMDNDPSRVTREAFGNVGLNRMSVNMLGALFLPGDERWHQNMTDEDNWNGTSVELDQYEGKYVLKEPCDSVYFIFSKADMMDWTFPRIFAEKAQHDKYKDAIISEMGEREAFSKKLPIQ